MDEITAEHKPLDVLVLAAGLGTRMRSNLAKVLHLLDGKPLIAHVCRTAAGLAPRKIYVVIGHQGAEVRAAVLYSSTTSGHASRSAAQPRLLA
ncbi:NTP transferase domain-containing protein [Leptolyngbya sp. 7M]|uniref:NTP transferase domain-containing protein n=1 Tax=Leptolyngbya sp. 7M TaxID=2812896 RepID=UPI001B8B8039|nr:NTP transferase domain-containing protein [Leptolyngbya sp. 7M]QYO65069.1 NTP transferase domain-containing protein [Leptolyngbya sp. 7M]